MQKYNNNSLTYSGPGDTAAGPVRRRYNFRLCDLPPDQSACNPSAPAV